MRGMEGRDSVALLVLTLTERSTTVTVPPMGFHVPAERYTLPAW